MESDWSDDSSSDSSDSSVFSSACSDSAIPRQQGRKRLRHVEHEQWKRKKREILKDSGKAHVTYTGAHVSSKLCLVAAKITVVHAFVWEKGNAFLTISTS